MNQQPFTIERTFNTSISIVWKAISNKEEMKKWYFDLAEFKPEAGFEFNFSGGPPEKQYLHLCKVIEVIPNKKLSYTWRYDGYEGNSLVTFELFEVGNKTKLKLTHEGLETFPANNKHFAKENFVMGWTELIGSSLSNYLEKN